MKANAEEPGHGVETEDVCPAFIGPIGARESCARTDPSTARHPADPAVNHPAIPRVYQGMTSSTCTPISGHADIRERERRPDHLADLLECLADLVVETGQQRRAIEALADDTALESTRGGVRRLAALEAAVKQVGLEAAAVHQLLQHEHLI